LKQICSKYQEDLEDDYDVLILFIFYERNKGEQSFYYPLINYWEDYDINDIMKWGNELMEEL